MTSYHHWLSLTSLWGNYSEINHYVMKVFPQRKKWFLVHFKGDKLFCINSKLQLSPQTFHRPEDRRLVRTVHNTSFWIFVFSRSFVLLVLCLRSSWKTHPQPIFSIQAEGTRFWSKILMVHGPVLWRHRACTLRKTTSSKFPLPCPTVGMLFFGSYGG